MLFGVLRQEYHVDQIENREKLTHGGGECESTVMYKQSQKQENHHDGQGAVIQAGVSAVSGGGVADVENPNPALSIVGRIGGIVVGAVFLRWFGRHGDSFLFRESEKRR